MSVYTFMCATIRHTLVFHYIKNSKSFSHVVPQIGSHWEFEISYYIQKKTAKRVCKTRFCQSLLFLKYSSLDDKGPFDLLC